MSNETLIAVITGASSGIGLATATALLVRGKWHVYLLDRNPPPADFLSSTYEATYIETDVTEFASLASAFRKIFDARSHLDFVFANAGIALHPDNLTSAAGTTKDEHPATPDLTLLDVNLKGVIYTSHLARHYFHLSTAGKERNLIITASMAGFYASPSVPVYTASKHAAVGWTRSIAPSYWKEDRIRVNAICPSLVATGIMPKAMYATFPEGILTPIASVVEAVLLLLDGKAAQVGEGKLVAGQTVEVNGSELYFRKQIDFCNPLAAAVMGSADV
ncbi:hypothetical protein B0A48_02262 [Cryoendolithus antarcticus]|uniref:NAD(P)-binding protein n=1 Tax=Cryoendolithus antarcticus TaxID=1507870 RepID=A0A1V8TNG9_9PEZI|nr:hypothetical protein B0A48_02262 [Cryoendolithus antarcticus]